ncbi:MAG: hypothetical protein Q8P35_01555 [Candidatus Yanofskybacteria bacterium]|nr:hypothetical protein [Candidatus Yanofskybacteria bacterium]
MTHSQKVETTFRMGLKGGLHLFSTTGASLHVASFHFDGHQHYRRHVDVDRIVGRIGSLREGVTIAEDIDIDDRTGDHRRAAECQGFDDCQLLQLTDLIVGGFRTVLGRSTSEAQKRVAAPLKELSDKWHAGPARMANSRWHGGFSVSECFLENNEWRFADIQPEPDTSQLRIDGI